MKIKLPNPYPADWTPWFAWHPVYIQERTEFRWLETIERRCTVLPTPSPFYQEVIWEYRILVIEVRKCKI